MFYFTVKQSPMYRQMSLEELWFGEDTAESSLINENRTNTRTIKIDALSRKYYRLIDYRGMIDKLRDFNEKTKEIREMENRRDNLYETFYIPKKSKKSKRKFRKINKPKPELDAAIRGLKAILEEYFYADSLYHTSAFAYIKKRCAKSCLERHQANDSRWFAKFDLEDFFGSTTLEFVVEMFSMIFPFNVVMSFKEGREELEKALSIAFLDGGLPQGTAISPMITNIMMIPIDFALCNGFRDFHYLKHGKEEARNYCVYTRYADDFLITSRYDFDFKQAEDFIVETLKSFNAPFTIGKEKTRYASRSGANWNLGLMLNKDNKITVGHKKKKEFQAMLCSFALDHINGKPWEIEDVQTLEGFRNYYYNIEGDSINGIVKHIGDKFGVDIQEMIKDRLRLG